jgi:hypothetical protein
MIKKLKAVPKRTLIDKAVWALVVFVGLSIIFVLPKFVGAKAAAPVAAMAEAPKSVEKPQVVELLKSDGQKEIVVIEQDHDTNSKNWMDYGNTIVGWIVALAGAYKLVRRTPSKKDEDTTA